MMINYAKRQCWEIQKAEKNCANRVHTQFRRSLQLIPLNLSNENEALVPKSRVHVHRESYCYSQRGSVALARSSYDLNLRFCVLQVNVKCRGSCSIHRLGDRRSWNATRTGDIQKQFEQLQIGRVRNVTAFADRSVSPWYCDIRCDTYELFFFLTVYLILTTL